MSIDPVIKYLRDGRERFLTRLCDLLRIPSISTAPAHAGDCRRAADFLAAYLRDLGLSATLGHTPGHPAVIGAHTAAGPAAPTVLLYGHYDVQPPEPLAPWLADPFAAQLRDTDAEGRAVPGGVLIARGCADNKGQHLAMLAGVEAHLAVHGSLPVNLKVLIEGEEEVGSAHLPELIRQRADELAADFVLLADGYMHPPGVPAICYSTRGLAYATVSLKGPAQDIHSGIYGGVVTNPANALATLLGRLTDDAGRVTLPGFYDGVEPVTDARRAEFEALGITEADFAAEAGVATGRLGGGERGLHFLERRWFRPTCDVNGLVSGYQGPGSKTIIPADASAKVSFRLVGRQDPAAVIDSLRGYVEGNCPPGLTATVEAEAGARPFVADRSQPAFAAMVEAIRAACGRDPSWVGGGGTLPILADFQQILDADSVFIGVVRPDNHLHGPNEQCNVADLHLGAEVSARFFSALGQRS